MTTTEMMQIALTLAGLAEIPQDSDIHVPGNDVKRVLAGIDMDNAAFVAAKMMGYDCVAMHHPTGLKMSAVGNMEERDHMEMMISNGVSLNIAQKTAAPRKEKIDKSMLSKNLAATAQLAALLGIASIGVHTPADLIVENGLKKCMAELVVAKERVTLKDIIDSIKEIREFRDAVQGPEIWIGKDHSYAGRIMVTMSGGGAPSLEEYKACVDAGVGTFVVMHMKPETCEELQKDGRCNVVITGHMASDSYGFNCILDAWEEKGLEIKRIGGIV